MFRNHVKSYERSLSVEILRATEDPVSVIGMAACITQGRKFGSVSDGFIKRLLMMGHTSLFEHVVYTFHVRGISRSLLAQVTRHRMASYTAGSQHYRDCSDTFFAVCERMTDNKEVVAFLKKARRFYVKLLKEGFSREEARQILPNAACVDFIWTINARSLINFLNLRLCYRNIFECRLLAHKVYMLVLEHFPELFEFVGPDCYMLGECRQGDMTCGRKWRVDVV